MATAIKRMTAISKGSIADADMYVNKAKTETVQFREQGRIPAAKVAEIKAKCKHKCDHVGCGKVFFNLHGLKCHQGRCKWKQWYLVDRILTTRWTRSKREFKIRWSGYSSDHDTWEPRAE